MSAKEEVSGMELDLEELVRLHETAVRPKVREILQTEIDKLKKKETPVVPQSNVAQVPEAPMQPAVTATASRTVVPPKYYKDITTYAWDQSEKFMKVYVTINGVQKLSKENVTTEFKNKSFRLRVENLDGTNYQCHVAFLWDDIVPVSSYHKVKTDTVLLMLKKSKEGKTWAYMTEREDQKKKPPKTDEKKDPNEGLMDILKKMYDEGDDEMKRTIAKSFSESRNKTPTDSMDS